MTQKLIPKNKGKATASTSIWHTSLKPIQSKGNKTDVPKNISIHRMCIQEMRKYLSISGSFSWKHNLSLWIIKKKTIEIIFIKQTQTIKPSISVILISTSRFCVNRTSNVLGRRTPSRPSPRPLRSESAFKASKEQGHEQYCVVWDGVWISL